MSDGKSAIGILFEDASLNELSVDFKTKATVIFETAVANQVITEKSILEEEYAGKLEEAKAEATKNMEEKIDSYLTYVAEEWIKENELAVENGIQVEIAENFLKGMKTLFEESYVEIPENKVDIVAEMAGELEAKSSSLDEAIDKNISLKKEIKEMKKSKIVSESTKGLADTQIDKVKDLVEMVDFIDEAQFEERVKSIVETYFKKKAKDEEADDEDDEDDEDVQKAKKPKMKKESVDESMKLYIDALSESIK